MISDTHIYLQRARMADLSSMLVMQDY